MVLLILNAWLTRASLRRGWRRSQVFTAWAIYFAVAVVAYVFGGMTTGGLVDMAGNILLTLYLLVLSRTSPSEAVPPEDVPLAS